MKRRIMAEINAYKIEDIRNAITTASTKIQFHHIMVKILFNIMIFIMYATGIKED
jgi:hypothetical protein